MSLNNQAMIAKALGRLDLSLQMLKEAFLKEPGNFEVLANLGRVSLQDNQVAEAERFLKEALHIRPQAINLGVILGKLLHTQGKHAEAKKVLQKFQDHEPQNFEVLFTLGLIAEELNDEQALYYFLRAGRIHPDDDRVVEKLDKLNLDS